MSDPNWQDKAKVAFKSPTALTAVRSSSASPTREIQPVVSPHQKQQQGEDAAAEHLYSHITQSTSVQASKDPPESPIQKAMQNADKVLAAVQQDAKDMVKSSVKDPNLVAAETAAAKPPEAAASGNTPASSMSSLSPGGEKRRNLDLKHNDNTFHVLADLVVTHFESKGSSRSSADSLDSMVPPSARQGFVEAVQYRLQHDCPSDSEAQIHVLTRQCRELGLDKEGSENPLLAVTSSAPVATTTKPAAMTITNQPTTTKPPSNKPKGLMMPELSPPRPSARGAPVPQIHPRDDSSVAGSVLTGASVTEAHVSATESLARQQLMAELRDASKFMAESKTPDAAKFWKEHVVKLQARLRALHGDGSSSSGGAGGSVANTPEEVLVANRRLLGEGGADARRQISSPIPLVRPPSSTSQQRQLPTYMPPNESGLYPEPNPSMQTVEMSPSTLVDVVAPADLPAGYTFEAEIDGKRFLATVPAGGVRKGETFSCLMKDVGSSGDGIPRGRWRDRLCDCGNYGCCHTHVLNTLFCPLLALGQVMTRGGLDFLGRPSRKGSRNSYSTMWSIVAMWFALNATVFAAYNYKWSRQMELTSADWIALPLINVVMIMYAIYAVSATRAALRAKYSIREKRCYDLEDFYCSTCCMPCTICQMSRHTADYDAYDAVCCSKTGVDDEQVRVLRENSSSSEPRFREIDIV